MNESDLLQTEVQSLSGITQDSAKLLSEKLALSRELALLKPETEHLRSQLAHQKDVLAEKLSLERQLNALEVELANEKRAVQRITQKQQSENNELEEELREQVRNLEKELKAEKRAAQKAKQAEEAMDSKQSEVEQELRQQIDDLEKQLAAEKKSIRSKKDKSSENSKEMDELRTKVEELETSLASEQQERKREKKDSDSLLADAQEQKEELERRLDQLKTKFREARDDLKAARAEITEAKQSATMASVAEVPKAKKSLLKKDAPAKPIARKRRVEEISDDTLILNTPTNGDGRPKRPSKSRAQALVGEKSEFSVTPFLNKTTDAIESAPADKPRDPNTTIPASDEETSSDPAVADEVPKHIVVETTKIALKDSEVAPAAPAAPKARGRPKSKVLGDAPSSKRNMKATKKIAPVLDKVVEEEGDEDVSTEQENRSMDSTAAFTKNLTVNLTEQVRMDEAQPPKKMKKRKVLGASNKTLFDDDDDEAVPQPAAKKSVKALGGAKTGGAFAKGPLGALRTGARRKSFSPLKRDRRGVNASFLS